MVLSKFYIFYIICFVVLLFFISCSGDCIFSGDGCSSEIQTYLEHIDAESPESDRELSCLAVRENQVNCSIEWSK